MMELLRKILKQDKLFLNNKHANTHSKKELEILCDNRNLSNRGNKSDLNNRLIVYELNIHIQLTKKNNRDKNTFTCYELKEYCKERKLLYNKNKLELIDTLINYYNKSNNNIKVEKKTNIINKTHNNETFGITAEVSLCKIYNISYPNHLDKRMDENICEKLYPICNKIKNELQLEITEHLGSDNGSIDFKLKNNETLSLKTLISSDNKICPQKIGQPTRNSWDKYMKNKMNLELENINDNKRKYFIKQNIDKLLQEYFKIYFAAIIC